MRGVTPRQGAPRSRGHAREGGEKHACSRPRRPRGLVALSPGPKPPSAARIQSPYFSVLYLPLLGPASLVTQGGQCRAGALANGGLAAFRARRVRHGVRWRGESLAELPRRARRTCHPVAQVCTPVLRPMPRRAGRCRRSGRSPHRRRGRAGSAPHPGRRAAHARAPWLPRRRGRGCRRPRAAPTWPWRGRGRRRRPRGQSGRPPRAGATRRAPSPRRRARTRGPRAQAQARRPRCRGWRSWRRSWWRSGTD